MRLEAKPNGTTKYVAQISGFGFLSAHLNLSDRPKESRTSSVLRVEGFDTNSATETVSVKWPEISFGPGDVVHLQLLIDVDGHERQLSAREALHRQAREAGLR
ncbi:MAG: hypothetical protein ACLQJ0_06670 [Steroidobacteraceae bacterium]